LKKQIFEKEGRLPKKPIPVIPFDLDSFLKHDEPQFVWYGHSVILLRIDKLNILIDPMFGNNASPIAPFSTSRFSENTLEILKVLPPIDLTLYTHDHYDHLDLQSVEILKNKCKRFFVAMGVERHLVSWGVKKEKISSFDWWQSESYEQLNITFTPTQHSSGRGILDQS